FEEGQFSQAFPNFGAERRGAPVAAFVRLAARSLQRHCQVLNPDFLIIQDDSLLHQPGITAGLKKGGALLVNSRKERSHLELGSDSRVVAIPATDLAQEILGRPIPNTALISAFVTLTGLVSPESVIRVLETRFRGEVLEANRQLVEQAAGMVEKGAWEVKA
ncbi:MAG TPA: 2-oxoacid:acceptor oxidoreductase family protein, partial [Mariprofundaceae bacterium]|nr:2-oxoacid:acceptor oxidoreductase family protein [Mariprofundaceae bacterium]